MTGGSKTANHGIVSCNKELGVYIAMELFREGISDDQMIVIAESTFTLNGEIRYNFYDIESQFVSEDNEKRMYTTTNLDDFFGKVRCGWRLQMNGQQSGISGNQKDFFDRKVIIYSVIWNFTGI